jgi:hypothetical protein
MITRASIHRKPHKSVFKPYSLRAVRYYSPQAGQTQLLNGCKLNQPRSLGFLFHLIDVAIGNGFAAEKNLHLTIFAHRKCRLWKSGGLGF